MKDAGVGVGDMGGDHADLQVLHEGLRRCAAALDAEGNDAAGAVGHVFFGSLVVFAGGQAGIVDPGHLVMLFQEFRDLLGVFTVSGHADRQGLQAQVEIKGVHGCLDGTQVAHELGRGLGDIGARLAEALRVGDPVIGFIRGRQAGELVGMGHPVKIPAVDDAAADRRVVAVHVLGRGMDDDVGAPLEGAAVDGGGEGVVDDERHAVFVGGVGKALDVKYDQGRVGDRLAEDRLGLGTEGRLQLLVGAVGVDKGEVDAHAAHGDIEEIEGTAVDRGRDDDMVSAAGEVEDREEGGRLAGGGQHGRGAALKRGDLGRHHIVGGVLQSGIKISLRLEVKELAHILAGVIFEGRALNDGDHSRLAVFGFISRLDAHCISFHDYLRYLVCLVYNLLIPAGDRSCRRPGCFLIRSESFQIRSF